MELQVPARLDNSDHSYYTVLDHQIDPVVLAMVTGSYMEFLVVAC